MTKSEVKKLVGKFGQASFNGKIYASEIYVTIKEVKGNNVILRTLEDNEINIKASGLHKFIQMKKQYHQP